MSGTKTVPEGRHVGRAWVLLAAIVAAVNSGLLWAVADRSFAFGDDGFYLYSMSTPWDYPASLTGFGYLLHPLFEILGGDIVWLKRGNLVITLMCDFALAASLVCWLKRMKAAENEIRLTGPAADSLPLLLPLLVAGGALHAASVPSYNTANIWMGTLFVATAIPVFLRDANPSVLRFLILGALAGCGFLVKWTSAVCLLGTFGLACLIGLGVTARSVWLAVAVAGLSAAFGAAAYWATGSQALSMALVAVRDPGASVHLTRHLWEALAAAWPLTVIAFLATIMSRWLSASVCRGAAGATPGKFFHSRACRLGLPFVLALGLVLVPRGVLSLWQVAIATALAHALWILAASLGFNTSIRREPSAIALVVNRDGEGPGTSFDWEKERPWLAVGLLLAMAPFTISFGTGNDFFLAGLNIGCVFLLALLVLLLLRASSSGTGSFPLAQAGLLACVLAAEVAIVSEKMLWPIDRNHVRPPPVWEKLHRVPKLARGAKLRLDAETKVALDQLNRKWLAVTQGNPWQPAIAPYPLSSSIPYLLGASMPGAPGYYWAGPTGAGQVERNWPTWMAGKTPFVIRYSGTEFAPEVIEALAGRGVRFPNDYVLAAKTKFLSGLPNSNRNLAYSIEIWAPKSAGIIR